MDLVLEARILILDQQRRSVGHGATEGVHPAQFRLRKVAQHEIMNQRLVSGMADAEPHAPVVVADMRADRAQTVVSGVAAADLHPDLCGRKIELVVKDRKGARVELVKTQRFADASARLVHVGLRRKQQDPLAADRPFRHEAGKAGPERTEAMPGSHRVDRHEADVVAIAGVTRARIAESRDDEHGAPVRTRTRRSALSPQGGRGRPALLLGGGLGPVGGTMVTTVRSVLEGTSLQPSGNLSVETCTESAKSRPVRSIVIASGILSAGARTSTECSTILTVPPFLIPGEASRFSTWTGRPIRTRAPAARRKKSTCTGRSVTTSSWKSRGSTRSLRPSMSISKMVVRKRPA